MCVYIYIFTIIYLFVSMLHIILFLYIYIYIYIGDTLTCHKKTSDASFFSSSWPTRTGNTDTTIYAAGVALVCQARQHLLCGNSLQAKAQGIEIKSFAQAMAGSGQAHSTSF